MAATTLIKLRRDTRLNWSQTNPVLEAGEIGIELDYNKFKIGTGLMNWNDLPYACPEAEDIPTKLSELANDTGFVNEEQLRHDGYVINSDLEDYLKKSELPPIPTKTSELTNDSEFTTISGVTNAGFIKSSTVDELYAKKTDLPTRTSQLTNDSGFLTQHQSLADYALKSELPTTAAEVHALSDATRYGADLEASLNPTTYVLSLQLRDQDNNALGTLRTIDLPLETVVVSGRYDSANKQVVLTLKDGSEIRFSVADLVSGLQPTIDAGHKVNADFIDDATSTHKFITSAKLSELDSLVSRVQELESKVAALEGIDTIDSGNA